MKKNKTTNNNKRLEDSNIKNSTMENIDNYYFRRNTSVDHRMKWKDMDITLPVCV